jgi:hypothetical protein
MAADKTIKRKPKPTKTDVPDEEAAPVKPTSAKAAPAGNLLTKKDARYERRYEPKASSMAVISVIAMSIGAVAVGAGTFGQWMRSEELGPHKAAPYLLVAGAILLLGVALFGQSSARPVRVGDAGVAEEGDGGEISRIEWRDVSKLILSASSLTVQASGSAITVPLDVQAQAVARILAEAKVRVPKRVEEVNAGTLEAVDDTLGEVLPLEPPQVAGERCAKSNKLIAFEKDARFCKQCGEVYHKEDVPKRCVTCDAKLL